MAACDLLDELACQEQYHKERDAPSSRPLVEEGFGYLSALGGPLFVGLLLVIADSGHPAAP
jgi:hypothetical protein